MCKPVHLLTGSVAVENLLARAAPLLRAHLTARPARKLVHVHVPAVQCRHDEVERRLAWRGEIVEGRGRWWREEMVKGG